MAKLQKQIESLNLSIGSQLPLEIIDAFAKSIADLKDKEIENQAVKEGGRIARFTLKSMDETIVKSETLLESSEKIILAFFRGNWCPYCNLELKALQDSLPEIEGKKVKLIAVSPQRPEYSLKLIVENHITFDILYDENNLLAKSLGISFELQDFVLPYYQQLGIDFKKYNGYDENSLPIPAVYVIDRDYTITYSFVDSDYMNRLNIEDLIKKL